MTDRNFKDGCVFVIGGTGGVGSACVKSFHEAGANVVFSYNSNLEEAFESIRAIYIDFESIINDEQGRGFSRVFLLFDFILANEYNKLGLNYYIMCTNVAQNSLGIMLSQYSNYGFSELTDKQDGQIKCTADPSVSDYYEDDFNTYYKYSPETITQLMLDLENAMEFQRPTMPYDIRELM